MTDTRSREMTKVAVAAMSEKKGENISIIDISEVSVIADYFVIVSADNIRQVQSIADEVEQKMAKAGFLLKQQEGYQTSGWILQDYNDIIVHIFNQEERLFFDIERIWSDGKKILDISEL